MQQLVVAAELTQQASDLQQLGPMLAATAATLAGVGIAERPTTLLADCGYWTTPTSPRSKARRSC